MTETRTNPMAKPDGFVPAVQRYSAVFGPEVDHIQVLVLGQQDRTGESDFGPFLADLDRLFKLANGPDHFDFATFTDEAGATNCFTTAYWQNRKNHLAWSVSAEVQAWWHDPAKRTGDRGHFWEPLPAKADLLETIAFKEYIRGISACPMSSVEAMGESGYWGAARDRIPRSATDRLVSETTSLEPRSPSAADVDPDSNGAVMITPPDRYVLIRSGVSWEDCGEEQLTSYQENVRPRLDAGMEFLQANPVETGCWSLRRVDVIGQDGSAKKETYCAGHFLSLADLEVWAHTHPTHLAIYGQAQKERTKYRDDLELRTYHEVYVVEEPDPFHYLNCHDRTGALGWFAAS